MKKVMSIRQWEKGMAQWEAEPPGLTVKQIKKLVKKDSNKAILDGFTKPLFAGEGFWSNGCFMLFEDVPEDVSKAYEVPTEPGYSYTSRMVKRDRADADKLAGACTVQVWPVEVQWRDKYDNAELAIMFSDGNGGRVFVPGGQLSAVLARAGKDVALTYWAQIPSGEYDSGMVLVQNGHRLGLMAGLWKKSVEAEPVASFKYAGELPHG
jgi:hypothetical protein